MQFKNLKEAQNVLKKIRKQQRGLADKSRKLREYIVSKGGNPSPYPDNSNRDKNIYEDWKLSGETFTRLSKKYGLSTTRISSICKRQKIKSIKQKKTKATNIRNRISKV